MPREGKKKEEERVEGKVDGVSEMEKEGAESRKRRINLKEGLQDQ